MDVEEKIKHQYTYEKMIIKYFEDKLNMSNKEINQFHFKHGDIAKIVLTDNNFYTLVPNYRKNDEKILQTGGHAENDAWFVGVTRHGLHDGWHARPA